VSDWRPATDLVQVQRGHRTETLVALNPIVFVLVTSYHKGLNTKRRNAVCSSSKESLPQGRTNISSQTWYMATTK